MGLTEVWREQQPSASLGAAGAAHAAARRRSGRRGRRLAGERRLAQLALHHELLLLELRELDLGRDELLSLFC